MRLVPAHAEIIEEDNIIKLIEKIGRTCYKSEDKITEESAGKFVTGLANRKHYAMLEHGHLVYRFTGVLQNIIPEDLANLDYVAITREESDEGTCTYMSLSLSHIAKAYNHEYSLSVQSYHLLTILTEIFQSKISDYTSQYLNDKGDYQEGGGAITLLDNPYETLFGKASADSVMKHVYLTFKFSVDRGVSHELVRHRCAVAQESQRYCCYTKDKFGREITYIQPFDYMKWTPSARKSFEISLKTAEDTYKRLVSNFQFKPEIARGVLPNATKTEVILTMPIWQWLHFLDLRYIGTTGNPHPHMKHVVEDVYNTLQIKGIIN